MSEGERDMESVRGATDSFCCNTTSLDFFNVSGAGAQVLGKLHATFLFSFLPPVATRPVQTYLTQCITQTGLGT